jgi:enoyl-CoA hydratase
MLRDLTAAFGDLAARPELRATVLEGAGPDFCAGADFSELEVISARGAGGAAAALGFDVPFTEALTAIAEHPVPVVAKVHGRALGGGCQLVLAADLVVAEEDARLGIPSARLGIVIPFESIERLVLAVGPRRAREMLFASRTLTAAEAEAWGLVNRTSAAGELDHATEELVADVVGAAPLSVRASKRGIAAAVAGLAVGGSSGSRDRADFDELAAQAMVSRDLAEGIAAFRERRRPEFGGT